jgi:hypothetical protein
MTADLDKRRKADRDAIAKLLVDVVEREGGTATIEPAPLSPRGLWVRIKADAAYVTITIDGESRVDGYLTAWNIEMDSDKRFSPAFGTAVRAEVNPHHCCKCMGYEHTLRGLVRGLGDALICIAAGKAFLPAEKEKQP